MIIKTRCNEGWVIFDEVDYVEHWEIEPAPEMPTEGGTFTQPIEGDTLDFICGITENPDTKINVVVMMNKNQTETSKMICYSPVYLMNNNGKTIEVL